ncbi:MAG: flotillin domain-containing protein, partial [Eubacteriales bacterium]|nr:flotillin domain-containing protein [Eubacteriales bacterium]
RYRTEQEAAARRVAMEEEARGIEAKGRAEADAILAKAEAMKAMGEASVLEMVLAALPEMVKNAAAPLEKTDKIVMYGDGNATKLVGDVLRSASQVTEGLAESTGIDLRALLAGFLGGRAASAPQQPEDTAPKGAAPEETPAIKTEDNG